MKRSRATNRALRAGLVLLASAAVLGTECDPKEADFFGRIGGAVPPGSFIGIVTLDGAPAAGVQVTLSGGPTTRPATTTAADGSYAFSGLAPGDYQVAIQPPAGSTCTPGTSVTAPVFSALQTVRNFACTTPPTTGTVTGRVVVNGSPVSGASVTVDARPAVTTDASGTFTVGQVPTGTQTVTTTLSGHDCPTRTASVQAGQTTSVGDIACTPAPGTLVVTVVQTPGNSPISGAQVQITGPGGTRSGTTASNGTVSFTGLAPGTYTASATVSGLTCQNATGTVPAGGTGNATVPCAAQTGGDFTVSLTTGWNHPANSTTSVECKVISTTPAQPGASFSVVTTGPNDGGPSGVIAQHPGGTLNSNGQAAFQVGITRPGTYTNTVTVNSSGVVRTAQASVPVTGSSNTCPVVSSSARFKRDVVPLLPDGLDLLGLRPVAFRYRAPYGDPTVSRLGLVAEEVAVIYPAAVSLDRAGRPESIHYGWLAAEIGREVERRTADAVTDWIGRAAALGR